MTFIKTNPLPGSHSLECEARGLKELARYQNLHGLNIPRVISVTPDQLTLERIHPMAPTKSHWKSLGEGLARMHSIMGGEFGFESSNFIGLNKQINTPQSNWGEFFVGCRLEYQIGLIDNAALKNRLLSRLERARPKLVDFLNAHAPRPSLLHGDLWSGNIMFDKSGPWLIDPAVYYGDRETDLAMTKMFGGFEPEFYSSYQQTSPLPKRLEIREKIYNLYHYLNHLNLFGGNYLGGVEDGIILIEKL